MAFVHISLKGRALRLLARREYSRLELERRLQRFEETPNELAHVLDELQTRGFIDEQRVVESVLHQRASKFGVERIEQELQAKGVAPETVTLAVSELRGTDLERAQEIWRKKFGTPASAAGDYARQARFLLARGFGSEVIRRVLAGGDEDFQVGE